MEAVRYQRLQGSDSEDPAEPRVTVHLYRQSARWYIRRKQRETCMRIFAALLLLALALAFAYYQLTYGDVEPSEPEEAQWALVDDEHWNSTWDKDFMSQPLGEEGKEAGPPRGNDDGVGHHHDDDVEGHHHDEEDEAGRLHEDEAGPHHEEDGDASHHDGEQADQPPAGHTHEHGVYQHAAVITASELCSDVGKDVLHAGGNIVDAGISALLCLCVVHPHAAGIGGVFSALYYNSTDGSARALNAVPAQTPSGRFGIPQVLQGLWVIHQQYGTMEWSELFSRPAQVAKGGFQIDGILATALQENEDHVTSSGLRDWFCTTNGSLKEEGAVSSNPKLAKVLQLAGSLMFRAAVPESILQALAQDLSPSERESFLDSIRTSTVAFQSPLSFELDGFRLYGAPPPASGNIIGDILKAVTRQKLAVESTDHGESSINAYLQVLNASKHGYAQVLEDVLQGSTATSGQSTPLKDVTPFNFANVGSHLSAADSHGNMLLISTSLNSSFGSKVISPSTGILLSDFGISESSRSFFWACPVLVRPNDEEDVFGVGATGGASIPIVVAQSIINHFYFEKALKDVARGALWKVTIGEDGVLRTFISGIANTSDLFLQLLDREEEVTATNTTQVAVPLLLVESHAEHVRASGAPPTCCHSDGV